MKSREQFSADTSIQSGIDKHVRVTEITQDVMVCADCRNEIRAAALNKVTVDYKSIIMQHTVVMTCRIAWL